MSSLLMPYVVDARADAKARALTRLRESLVAAGMPVTSKVWERADGQQVLVSIHVRLVEQTEGKVVRCMQTSTGALVYCEGLLAGIFGRSGDIPAAVRLIKATLETQARQATCRLPIDREAGDEMAIPAVARANALINLPRCKPPDAEGGSVVPKGKRVPSRPPS